MTVAASRWGPAALAGLLVSVVSLGPLGASPSAAEPQDRYWIYDRNPFNPANRYDPRNPYSLPNRHGLDSPLSPANRYDPDNPLSPARKYDPTNPFGPARKYDPDNPLGPAGRFDPSRSLRRLRGKSQSPCPRT